MLGGHAPNGLAAGGNQVFHASAGPDQRGHRLTDDLSLRNGAVDQALTAAGIAASDLVADLTLGHPLQLLKRPRVDDLLGGVSRNVSAPHSSDLTAGR